jgi:hypothetical protein
MEKARVGLDILYFLQDPRVDPEWQPSTRRRLGEISRGEKAIESLEKAVEDLANKKDEPPPSRKKRRSARRPRRTAAA